MEQYKFDEANGLWYKLEGDYYLPCLSVPEEVGIGIWGERRRRFLRENHNALYTALSLGDKLEDHLRTVNADAEVLFDRLVRQMAAAEDVTEQLKAEDPEEWIGHMNNIRIRAAEIVKLELIFT